MKITINLEFGSDYQKENVMAAFISFMTAWKLYYEKQNKKTKIQYAIEE